MGERVGEKRLKASRPEITPSTDIVLLTHRFRAKNIVLLTYRFRAKNIVLLTHRFRAKNIVLLTLRFRAKNIMPLRLHYAFAQKTSVAPSSSSDASGKASSRN
ncbi:hypothetical protein LSPCS325_22270 [Lysinibacillus sp. CTST325]